MAGNDGRRRLQHEASCVKRPAKPSLHVQKFVGWRPCPAELDAPSQTRLSHRHRALSEVRQASAYHRLYRDPRSHQNGPFPSRRSGRRQRTPCTGAAEPGRARPLALAHRFLTPLTDRGASPPAPRSPSPGLASLPPRIRTSRLFNTPHGVSEMPAPDPSPTHETGSSPTPRYSAGDPGRLAIFPILGSHPLSGSPGSEERRTAALTSASAVSCEGRNQTGRCGRASETAANRGSHLTHPCPVTVIPERTMTAEAGSLPRMNKGQEPECAALELDIVHHAVVARIRPVRSVRGGAPEHLGCEPLEGLISQGHEELRRRYTQLVGDLLPSDRICTLGREGGPVDGREA